MADSRPDSDSTPSKPRGLWSLMGTAPESAEPPIGADDETSGPESPKGSATDSAEPVPPKQRGLWGMMGQAPSEVSVEPPSSQIAPDSDAKPETLNSARSPDEAPARRGLFALMQRADEIEGDVGTDEGQTPSPILEDQDEPDDVEMLEVVDAVDDIATPTRSDKPVISSVAEVINLDELEAPRYRLAEQQTRKQIRISLIGGIAAILASGFSIFPNVMSGLPATVLGFGAIIAGYLAITGPGRRELSQMSRVVSIVGMLCGTVGIFLGPTLIAGLGRSLREANGQQATRTHLEKIGEGLERHYIQHEAYPIGGTFSRNDAGAIHGQHGWMTFLLPFVGEAALYQRVDQTKPFDDPVNRNVMGNNVTVYFAAGGDRSRIGDGFAVAHFAGVGGEISDTNGLAHLGIFERDTAVKREEVTDGLSSTLIVGELAGTYPPWGDPENWRKIGRGLNKDVNGFGSYSGQGTMFLLGDGTVKYFSNKTDPKLLEKMSTRDGAEELSPR